MAREQRFFLLSLLLSACATSGSFTEAGFIASDDQYVIPYAAGSARTMVGAGWVVSNYSQESGQIPTSERTEGRFESTLDWEYASGEPVTVTTPTYELLLEHTSNAVIWVRLLPIPADARTKDIKFVAENYVNALAGSILSDHLNSSRHMRRVSTKILASTAVRVMNRPAQAVDFEVVNLDQLEHDASAPRTRARIVLVQRWFRKPVDSDSTLDELGAYLLLGYCNDAPAFDERLPEFEALVASVRTGK